MWQERWASSSADSAGNLDRRHLAMRWLQSTGWAYQAPKNDHHALGSGTRNANCGATVLIFRHGCPQVS
jgi:hypothetical protein